MRKTKRRSQKSRKDASFNFQTLEPRQLFAADVGVSIYHGVDTGSEVATVQTSQSQDDHENGMQDRIQRIVNGTETDGYDAVGIVNGGCTGTLIAPNAVLTAAHCVEDGGQHTFEVNGKTYTATQATIHPEYESKDVDLAVMILSEDVKGVQPYELSRVVPKVGEMLTIVGFGGVGTGDSGHDGSFGVKHEGTTPIDKIDPITIEWNFDNNSESNTAPGDSGGPAFLNHGGKIVLAGVTSGGLQDNAGIGDTSFDTRVDAFVAWIDGLAGTFDGSTGDDGDNTNDDDTNDDNTNDDNNDGETSKTFASNTKVNIPANQISTVTTNVTSSGMSGAITDVDVKLDINHSWNEDLNVTLISPSGERIPLFEAVGGDSENFKGTVLDQQAGVSIEDGSAPYTGTFKPVGNLSNLNGEDPNGRWVLEVEDTFEEDGGRINSFAVTITTNGAGDNDNEDQGDELAKLAAKIDAQYELNFAGSYFENFGGQGEKWLSAKDGWLYLLPNGTLMKGSQTIAEFSSEYFVNPKLLHAAGDPALAARVDAEHGLKFTGSYHENAGGVNEKWMQGNDGWYYIMPNGRLFKGGTLVAQFDTAYYEAPSLIHEASNRSRRMMSATQAMSAQTMNDNIFEDDDDWWS